MFRVEYRSRPMGFRFGKSYISSVHNSTRFPRALPAINWNRAFRNVPFFCGLAPSVGNWAFGKACSASRPGAITCSSCFACGATTKCPVTWKSADKEHNLSLAKRARVEHPAVIAFVAAITFGRRRRLCVAHSSVPHFGSGICFTSVRLSMVGLPLMPGKRASSIIRLASRCVGFHTM